jgi:hypothetical protein
LLSFIPHHEAFALSLLFIVGFACRLVPLLPFSRVGYDPFLHYQFSLALPDARTSITIFSTQIGQWFTIYYPPLFHLVSLGFFLAFPTADPYLIPESLAAVLDALQKLSTTPQQ